MRIRVEIDVIKDARMRYREYICEDYQLIDRTLFIVCGYQEGSNPNTLTDFAVVLAEGDTITTKYYPFGTPIPRRDDEFT